MQGRRSSGLALLRARSSQARPSSKCAGTEFCGCRDFRLDLLGFDEVCHQIIRLRGCTDRCSAFNAIISSSVVALDLSYAMPIAVNCLRGRKTLPDRKWKVPNMVGWVIDIVRLSYLLL